MNQRIHIIGIGSPFGDDRLGWEAAQSLRGSAVFQSVLYSQVQISVLDRPGAMLPLHWRRDDIVILLDAICSGAAPGTRHCFDAQNFPGTHRPDSSHGFGIASAIGLARALGNMPARLLLRGIESDPAWEGFSLSPVVVTVMPSFIADISIEVLELAGFVHPEHSACVSSNRRCV